MIMIYFHPLFYNLNRERATAPATLLGVWVLEVETAEAEGLYVIYPGSLDVDITHGIHVELDTLGLEDLITILGIGLEVHVIGETGTPAADDHHTNTRIAIII